MGLLVDNINKIAYILPHKCGQYTISTFIMKIYGFNLKSNYYVSELKKLGLTTFKKEYKDHYKILVLRNPFERFISGFLQDALMYQCDIYKNIDLTFYEYCLYLKEIYDKENIDYYIKNNNKIQFNNNYHITSKKMYKNKLNGHIAPMYNEINDLLVLFEYDFDKVIFVDELNETLNDIKLKFNINIEFEAGNKKIYNNNITHNIINTPIYEIAYNLPCPMPKKFYNKEIYDIVKLIYEDDFNLIKKFNIDDKLNFDYTTCDFLNNISSHISNKNDCSNCCILIIPNKFNSLLFDDFIKSKLKYELCDIYITVPELYFNKYNFIEKTTNIKLFSSNENLNVCSKNIVKQYLNMYSDKYSKIIIYNDLPIFTDDFDINKQYYNIFLYKINLDDNDWYNNEIKKDIDIILYESIYKCNYNGIMMDSKIFLEIFNDIQDFIMIKNGNYPVIEYILPTIIMNNDYDTNEIYSLDNTLWNKNSEKLENYLSFTVKY